MKFIFALFLVVSVNAYAQEERIIRTISHETVDVELTLEAKNFVPNIMGYACAWPGYHAPEIYQMAQLRHLNFGLFPDAIPLRYNDLQFRFCSPPSIKDVFGDRFHEGEKLNIKVDYVLEVVEFQSEGQNTVQLLREKLSADILGVQFEGVASVGL